MLVAHASNSSTGEPDAKLSYTLGLPQVPNDK